MAQEVDNLVRLLAWAQTGQAEGWLAAAKALWNRHGADLPVPAVEGVQLAPGEVDLLLRKSFTQEAPSLVDAFVRTVNDEIYAHALGEPRGGRALINRALTGTDEAYSGRRVVRDSLVASARAIDLEQDIVSGCRGLANGAGDLERAAVALLRKASVYLAGNEEDATIVTAVVRGLRADDLAQAFANDAKLLQQLERLLRRINPALVSDSSALANYDRLRGITVPALGETLDATAVRLNEAEGVLKAFVSRLPDPTSDEPWFLSLYKQIRLRLEGRPDKSYLMSLRVASKAVDEEKARVIAAAMIFELANRDKLVEARNYNKTVLFRLALDMQARSDKLGNDIRSIVENINLAELSAAFLDIDRSKRVPDDLPRLAKLALERREREADAANRILDLVAAELFSADAMQGYWGTRFLSASARFEAIVVDHAFAMLPQGAEVALFRQMDKLIADEERIVPEELAKEFPKYSHQAWERDKRIEKLRAATVEPRRLLGAAQNLAAAHARYHVALKTEQAAQEQRRLAEEAAREQQRLAEQAAQEQRQLEDRKVRANAKAKSLLENLKTLSVAEKPTSLAWRNRNGGIDTVDAESLAIINWERDDTAKLETVAMISTDGSLASLRDFQEAVRMQQNTFVEPQLRERIQSYWNEILPALHKAVENAFARQARALAEAIFDLCQGSGSVEVVLRSLKQQIEAVRSKVALESCEGCSQALREVIAHLEGKAAPLAEEIAVLAAEAERLAAEEHEIEAIREQVEEKIDYLRELYAEGTGLELNPSQGRASDSSMGVGSVTMGLGLRQKLSQQLQLRLTLDGLEDGIDLEIGEDLAAMRKRLGMVDWVAAHEVGHLVDRESESATDEADAAEIEALASEVAAADRRALVAEMLSSVSYESYIDGLGLRMAYEYGTSDKAATTAGQRLSAIASSFETTMSVVEHIVRDQAIQPDDQDLQSRFAVIMLRFVAAAERIADDSARSGSPKDAVDRARGVAGAARHLFGELNANASTVLPGKEELVIALCRERLARAELTSFPASQQEADSETAAPGVPSRGGAQFGEFLQRAAG